MSATSAPLILCYHAVSDEWEHQLAVRKRALDRQLRTLLLRGYRPVDAFGAVEGRGRLLHVTFDDAFRNVVDALPTLERLKIPATLFACADYARDGRPLAVPRLSAEAAAHPEHLATMTWDELRGAADRGVEIGSHTLTHPSLPALSDEELERQLRDSRALVEAEIGRPCLYLAYPFGDHDERVRTVARRAGYAAAFALRQGASHEERFALPRVDLYRKDHLLRATVKTTIARAARRRLLTLIRPSCNLGWLANACVSAASAVAGSIF